jgi:hypothetical protein
VYEETQFHPDLPDAQAIESTRESGLFAVEDSSPDLTRLPPDAELGEGEAVAMALGLYGESLDACSPRTRG